MSFETLSRDGILLLGCGKMGSALLEGWLAAGLPPPAVHVRDPNPGPRLQALRAEGLALNGDLPAAPALCLIAVKPQIMDEALPDAAALGGGGTVILSIAAGTPIARFEAAFGPRTPVVRAMPNTPAAVGRGITAIVGNAAATDAHLALAEQVLSAVGEVVRLQDEGQMDAVTGVSGSGPAYVFHLIECLAAAGAAEGLPPALALQLARATVAGAGALATAPGAEDPATLRRNVTSPNGTTAAGLEVLMDERAGLPPLIRATVAAATRRSRELAGPR
ncbi:pyrroline-5-carboxylate reductase [Rhodobacteraceae bacterium 2CG4]|uniref:Pyrroline-5-carboxylate reductase n=1 Tax=Halovulum marinum TaxID=2662447 RepID=A0A6L5Z141_9RHOB|nr:pyrroline-5-carboxylate reductase [Halovulum marinum]MSU89694.1 pyrroline-5-carboxylate reductase [Halovulum marinum]